MDSPEFILKYLASATFAKGAGMTLAISVLSLAFGMLVGLVVALLQESRLAPLRGAAVGYLWLFRGTPVLFQLIFVFNVLPLVGLTFSGFTCAIIGLSLNEGAYMAEIMRSGIQAVGRGQRTAGRALGLKDWQVMRWIVLPQAVRIIIPPVGNQFIGMLKLSALVSVIAVEELLLIANQTASANFRYIEALTAAGIYYLAMTTVLMLLQAQVERWAKRRGRRPSVVKAVSLTQRLIGVTAGEARTR
ncbi:MAG: amino acid ABC transporter permease [Alphaproteobacteria bacterium]|nr:amino acid ABC transporter permease [Alphaproteobacteria bacterium]